MSTSSDSFDWESLLSDLLGSSGSGGGSDSGSSTFGMDQIGSIIQGGVGIGEIVAGILIQDETRDKIKEWKDKYPKMNIPSAVIEATDLYRTESQRTRLPGQDIYEQQIGQSTARGVSQSREAATSAADLLGATTSLYGQESQAMGNLQIEAARQQAQNKQMYGQQLNQMGQWQQQQYYMNEYYPWVSHMNELQGIQQSAYDMLVGGINTLAASGANFGGGSATYNTPSDSMTQDWNQMNNQGNNQQQQPNYLNYSPQGINWQDTSQMPAETQGQQIDLETYNNLTNIWGY